MHERMDAQHFSPNLGLKLFTSNIEAWRCLLGKAPLGLSRDTIKNFKQVSYPIDSILVPPVEAESNNPIQIANLTLEIEILIGL